MNLWKTLGSGSLFLGLYCLAHRRQAASQDLLGNRLLLGRKAGHQGIAMGGGRVEALGPTLSPVNVASRGLVTLSPATVA